MPYEKHKTQTFETVVAIHEGVGDSPKVLLIHGLDCTKEIFFMYPIVNPFLTYIAYDQRGFGSGKALNNSYKFEEYVKDAHSIFEKYNPDYVVGHSFGGVIAQELAIEYGVPTVAMQTTVSPPWFAGENFEKIQLMLDREKMASFRDALLRYLPSPVIFMHLLALIPYNPVMPASKHINELLSFPSMCEKIKNKKIKVIGGKYDRVVKPEEIRELAKCANTEAKFFSVNHFGVLFTDVVASSLSVL